MKKILLFSCLAILFSSHLASQNTTNWFYVKEVATKVWQISDHGDDNMYLIEGRDSSLLVDTGLGVADLATLVKKLSSKPLIVVNTHAHPDHSGANYQFEKIYLHPADSADARGYSAPRARTGSSANMPQANSPSEAELYKGKIHKPGFKVVRDGQIFDLGGRRIQVIYAPGHTPGELCFLDMDHKLLFTGDNTNALVWLWLPNCRPLHEYLVTLEMLTKRQSEYTTIFPGHKEPLPADFIKDQIACVKGILDGTLERKPYQSARGSAVISVYGRASVVFNPANL
jgi:hydroxyacylglutathione hydrolase